jgi:hypothetical protein
MKIENHDRTGPSALAIKPRPLISRVEAQRVAVRGAAGQRGTRHAGADSVVVSRAPALIEIGLGAHFAWCWLHQKTLVVVVVIKKHW